MRKEEEIAAEQRYFSVMVKTEDLQPHHISLSSNSTVPKVITVESVFHSSPDLRDELPSLTSEILGGRLRSHTVSKEHPRRLIYKKTLHDKLKVSSPILFNSQGVLLMERCGSLGQGELVGHWSWKSEVGLARETILCGMDCTMGSVTKSDYISIMYQFEKAETEKRLPYFMTKIFKEQLNIAAARKVTLELVSNETVYEQGKVVAHHGEQPEEVFLVGNGIVQMVKEERRNIPKSEYDFESQKMLKPCLAGRQEMKYVLYEVGPGEFFGINEALSDTPRPCSVFAKTPCIIMKIQSSILKQIMKSSPSLDIFIRNQVGVIKENNDEYFKRIERVSKVTNPIRDEPSLLKIDPTKEDEKKVLRELSRITSKDKRIPRTKDIPNSKKRMEQYFSKPKDFWMNLDQEYTEARREHIKYVDKWILRRQRESIEERKSRKVDYRPRLRLKLNHNSSSIMSENLNSKFTVDEVKESSINKTKADLREESSLLKRKLIDSKLLSKVLLNTKLIDDVLRTDVAGEITRSLSYHVPREAVPNHSPPIRNIISKSMDNNSYFQESVSVENSMNYLQPILEHERNYQSKEKNKHLFEAIRSKERKKLEILTKKIEPKLFRRKKNEGKSVCHSPNSSIFYDCYRHCYSYLN